MQSGGPTPVINRSLYGVVSEATATGKYGKVLGARRAIEGAISGTFSDLTVVPSDTWTAVASTPGSALGTSRRKLSASDIPPILDNLAANGITAWVMIGGNDSAENALAISKAARNSGYDLSVMHVPKTVDNDLMETDHSPGYGSAARFVANATLGAGRDAEAMGAAAPITVLEVAGRDSGWLVASSALAKREERDAPHLIVLPETPFDGERFIDAVEDILGRLDHAVIAVQENVTSADGRPLSAGTTPLHVDEFGHEYHEGAGRYLTELLMRRLQVRVRYDRPGSIQRSVAALVSSVDANEAEAVGRHAVQCLLDGESTKMVTLVRESSRAYASGLGVAQLEKVAGLAKLMPLEFVDGWGVTQAFHDYAEPLIGEPLPVWGRLD